MFGFVLIFLMADEVPSGGEALTALYNRPLCSCAADKAFGHSITAAGGGRTRFQVKGIRSGQGGEYHLLAQIAALMWLQLGLAFTGVKAFAFSFLLLVPKWIDYV